MTHSEAASICASENGGLPFLEDEQAWKGLKDAMEQCEETGLKTSSVNFKKAIQFWTI